MRLTWGRERVEDAANARVVRFREMRAGKLAVRLSVRVRVLDAPATYNNNIIHLLFTGKKETTNNLVNSVIDTVGVGKVGKKQQQSIARPQLTRVDDSSEQRHSSTGQYKPIARPII